MAERRMHTGGAGTRLAVFARALGLLAGIAVGIPALLVWAARERFGGAAPFHGVASPSDWRVSDVRAALTDRLTEQTIADILIRLSLVVAWVGAIVIVLTVIAEVAHMVRHDGLAMPDVRGFGFSQRTARVIAAGLLVVVPLFTAPPSAIAEDGPTLPSDRAANAALDSTVAPPRTSSPPAVDIVDSEDTVVATGSGVAAGQYVVRPGDSIFGIAERLAGPESRRVASFAEQLVDLNMGRQMPDGRRFTNAAFLDVGWVLELPAGSAAETVVSTALGAPVVHVVDGGESLWSIAEDELGDPARWPEVFDANEGRTFDDGRQLTDPDLIHPGWDLELPSDSPTDELDPPAIEITLPVGETVVPLVGEPLTELSASAIPDRLRESIEVDGPANEAVERPSVAGADDAPNVPSARVNHWVEAGAGAESAAAGADAVAADGSGDGADESSVADLLALGGAAMLSAGVLTLLAVRRRNQLRRARPRAVLPEPAVTVVTTERALRSIDAGERFERVATAIRAVAMPLVEHGRRVEAVLVGVDGELELRSTGPVELPSPWEGSGSVWRLAASTPLELLADAAKPIAPPCPALVQLGTDDAGRDVYVDLESLEAIEVGGPGSHADAIVAAVAATLAGSLLAEVTTLVGVGVADEAFLGHRRYVPARDGQRAFEAASDAIGSTASMTTTTFELRSRGTATETWEPAVVLAGAAAGTMNAPADRNGLALVSASPIHGPSSRLAPDRDAWVLLPAGIRLTPIGLTPADIGAIAELVTVIDPLPESPAAVPTAPASPGGDPEDDRTLVPADRSRSVRSTDHPGDDRADGDEVGAVDRGAVDVPDGAVDRARRADPGDGPGDVVVVVPPAHQLLVRMIGQVEVIDRDGTPVVFERSKTRELVAWLATHRDRSTRSSARTALWELDVRDATFANVVSEARRSLARLVEPPAGEEWVGRTMTDALPLHESVLSDVDLLRHALEAARLQPPAQAIATLAPAVDLIAGVPFEGTSYLWPDSEGITSNLVLLATTATTELAAHCLSVGDIEGVFSATGRGLRVLPAHEELIGLRMEAHARAGDHAGVRQEWESYERVINGDPWSDGEPAPKLVELRRRLLHPTR